MSAVAAAGVATELGVMRALGIFGGLALLMAAVGLNGVMARVVADRRHEIGVRLALGASPRCVRWLVFNRTLKLTVAGVGCGAAASVLLSRQLEALLHGVSGADPLVFAASAAVLCGAALVASYVPARRASSIDPLSVIKAD
jgi:ABC-type antimicrobial peptide transport system permease subunit